MTGATFCVRGLVAARITFAGGRRDTGNRPNRPRNRGSWRRDKLRGYRRNRRDRGRRAVRVCTVSRCHRPRWRFRIYGTRFRGATYCRNWRNFYNTTARGGSTVLAQGNPRPDIALGLPLLHGNPDEVPTRLRLSGLRISEPARRGPRQTRVLNQGSHRLRLLRVSRRNGRL